MSTRLASIFCITLLTACNAAPAEEDLTLASAEEAGKADGVAGKQLRFEATGTVPFQLEETDDQGLMLMRSRTEVVEQTATAVRFRAPRVSLGKLGDYVQHVIVARVPSDEWLGRLSTRMAFLLQVRYGAEAPWSTVSCRSANYFTGLLVQPSRGLVTALDPSFEWLPLGITQLFRECGLPIDPELELAIIPFPASGWGSLEGRYDVTLGYDVKVVPRE